MTSFALAAHLIPLAALAAATAEGVVITLRGQSYDWRAYLCSSAIALGRRMARALASLVPLSAWTPLLDLVSRHRLFDIPLHHAWSLALLVLAEEFCYYGSHRASHSIRWLWATHVVHHSPSDLNLAVAYRLGWTAEISGTPLFFLPLVWLGFPVRALLTVLAVNLLYQFALHARWIPKLGPVEWLLNTPSHHRVHHACNPEYLGRAGLGANYGGMLIVFDRLFGTLRPERENIDCRYGLARPLTSSNPVYVALHGWLAIAHDLAAARSWRDRLACILGRPVPSSGAGHASEA
ncbi:MAG TPA: sterol desaturase family protein [Steroidobacteraceae bacterium]|nr:sterol desaturase family protein [Steroidobacteraceae bacterium]